MNMKIISLLLLLIGVFGSCTDDNLEANKNLTLLVTDTIKLKVPRPSMEQQTIAIINENEDFCSYAERDFFRYYENSLDSSFNVSYLSAIRNSKATLGEDGTITYHNLKAQFSNLNQLMLSDLIPINEDSSIVVTENDFFHLLVGDSVLLSKPFHEVFNTEQYYYVSHDQDLKNTTPVRLGNDLLITFGGDLINKGKHDLDFKIFGLLNIKDLSFKMLDFTPPPLSSDVDRFFSPAYLNLSKIKDDVYLRFGSDTTLYSIIKGNSNITLKGLSKEDIDQVDSLRSNCKIPQLANFFINPRWSNLFALEHLQIYCVVGFVPSDFKVQQSRINLSFKSFIDIYDRDFHFIERILVSDKNAVFPPVFEAYDRLYFMLNNDTATSLTNDSVRLKTFIRYEIKSN